MLKQCKKKIPMSCGFEAVLVVVISSGYSAVLNVAVYVCTIVLLPTVFNFLYFPFVIV
jgi:hypothetical protein